MLGNFSLDWINPYLSRFPSQQSSILIYVQPCLSRPLLTMASAAARIFPSSTAPAKQFQLFQPSGGVRAIWSPSTISNGRLAFPNEFLARKVTVNFPADA